MPEVGPDAVRLTVTRGTAASAAAPAEAATLRVGKTTTAGALAGAIAGKARDGVTVLAATGSGPAAVLKLVKAVALARGYVREAGLDVVTFPRFVDLKVADEERTGVCFDIYITHL
mgnify:CR=1 FL=1